MFIKKSMRKGFLFISLIFLIKLGNSQVVKIEDINSYIGKTITAYGRVEDAAFLQNSQNQPTLINMGGKFPNQKLTVVIYGSNRLNFGYKPEVVLLSQVVYVTGKVQLYKDKPQIVISSPFEISLNPPTGELTNTPPAAATTRKIAKPALNNHKSEHEPKQTTEKRAPEPVSTPKEEPVQQVPARGEIILNSNITLRGGPGKNFNNSGTLKKGTPVTIISSSYGWTKISAKAS
ncbi:MAG: hypothetical protein JWQ96_1112, partial [Segetibacter sp.]|nr:hypothetical protein [Segetibacter sp.]